MEEEKVILVDDNDHQSLGDNHMITWRLQFPEDGRHIILIRDGEKVATSDSVFSGSQTITQAIPDSFTKNIRLVDFQKFDLVHFL